MDLTEFLLARIADDEAVARAATPGPWVNDGGIYSGHPTNEVVDYAYDDNAPHIARHDPTRVLAECEAKRQILGAYMQAEACAQEWEARTRDGFVDPRDVRKMSDAAMALALAGGLKAALHALAVPYAEHPDFDPVWRV